MIILLRSRALLFTLSFGLFLGYKGPVEAQWQSLEKIPRPLNTEWRIEDLLPNTVRISLFTNSGNKTKIFYEFNRRSLDLVQSSIVDEALHLKTSSQMGERNWQPHPFVDESLEARFFNLLLDLGFPEERRREIFPLKRLKFLPPSDYAVWKTEDSLNEIDLGRPSLSFDQLLSRLIDEERTTERELIKWESFSFLGDFIQSLDFIEPIRGDLGHEDQSNLNAFNLSPLLELSHHGRRIIEAIEDYAYHSDLDPISWWQNSHSRFPLETRMTLLILLTHNHLAEDNFIKAVVLREGIKTGFRAALALNSAYGAEREYWENRHHENAYWEDFWPAGPVDFVNQERKWVVSFDCLNGEWLPYQQLYRFYGGFVSAFRMKENLHIPSELLPALNEKLGKAYKMETQSASPQNLIMSQKYYRAAARAVQRIPYSAD